MKKPASKPARKNGRPPKGNPKLVAELVAAALARYRGNISAIAREFNVSRSSVNEFVRARPILAAIQADMRETRIDDAESALDRAVIHGEAWAVCFFLKTQGKSRGYVERQEVEQIARASLVIEEEVVSGGSDSPEGATPPGAV